MRRGGETSLSPHDLMETSAKPTAKLHVNPVSVLLRTSAICRLRSEKLPRLCLRQPSRWLFQTCRTCCVRKPSAHPLAVSQSQPYTPQFPHLAYPFAIIHSSLLRLCYIETLSQYITNRLFVHCAPKALEIGWLVSYATTARSLLSRALAAAWARLMPPSSAPAVPVSL